MGGGIVLDPIAPLRARAWATTERDPATLLARVVAEGGAAGVTVEELPVRLGVPPARAAALAGSAKQWRVGERIVGSDAKETLAAATLSNLLAFHSEHPIESGAPLQWLRSRLRAPDEVSAALVETLVTSRRVVVEQGVARLADFTPRLSAAQERLSAALLGALQAAGQEPPSLEELAVSLRADPVAITSLARFLAREGLLVAVEPARYYPTAAVDALVARLREGMRPEADYGPAELRELLGFSRKFLIPFLEFSDRAGHTLRDPSGRRRRAGA
jgi:selenocysteine-specific elongation factor